MTVAVSSPPRAERTAAPLTPVDVWFDGETRVHVVRRCIGRTDGALTPPTAYSVIETSSERFNQLDEPLGRRPADDADEDRSRPVPLRRRALVQHAVRPRRHHHRAADALARPGHGPRRAGLPGRHAGDGVRSPSRTPSRARSCTRRAAARWRPWARSRSAATTAASMPRRCSSCWPAPTTSAPATARSSSRSGRNVERGAATGSIATATATATASSSTRAASPDGLVQQGWKDSHDSVFHADGTLARGADRAVRGAGLRLRRHGAAPRDGRRARARRTAPPSCAAGRDAARALRGGLLVRGSRHLRAGPRRREAALPGAHLERRPLPVHRHRRARPRRGASPRRCWTPTSFSGWGIRTLAASESRATTRCRTTTARSGRTTTP